MYSKFLFMEFLSFVASEARHVKTPLQSNKGNQRKLGILNSRAVLTVFNNLSFFLVLNKFTRKMVLVIHFVFSLGFHFVVKCNQGPRKIVKWGG